MSRKNWTSEKIFTRLLTNKTRKTYWDNIRELRQRPNKNVFEKAVELGQSNIEKEKVIGIDILAQLGIKPRFKQKETIDLCFKLLEIEQSPKILESILFALSHNNESMNNIQVSKIIRFKNHRYSDVRFGVVQALSGIEDEDAINTLIELSTDKHPDIRDWATFSIGTQIEEDNESITKALWNRLDDSFENVRFEAIAGLAKRKDKRIKNILIHELENIDDNGSIILESIEEYGDIDFIKLLEKQIKINRKTKRVNENWLKDTIERVKTNAQ